MTPPTPATEPTMIVEAFLEAFVAMDFDTALTFIAGDCEYTNIPIATVRGPAGIREVLQPFFAPIHENEFVILRKSAAGPVVFLERLDRHRLDRGWRELPVNSVFEVHAGMITVWRDYFDLATAARSTIPVPPLPRSPGGRRHP
jgi:limonene-1,2-epoxide hydrolase